MLLNGNIKQIEAFELAVPLPQPLQLGLIAILQREYTVVRVHAENGKTGTAIGLTRNAPVAATVLRCVASHYQGGAIDEYQLHYERAVGANICLGTNGIFWRALSLVDCAVHDLLGRMKDLPVGEILGGAIDEYQLHYERAVGANICLGTNGIFWRALSLVDCAVHDLLGRMKDLPVGEILGGKMRPVPCLFVGGYPFPDETPASLRAEIRRMCDAGPSGIKIGSFGTLERDTERLRSCREEMPGGPPLMIDLYWQFRSVESLLKYAAQWSEFNMGWVEDPVRFDDYQSAALLAENLLYPVAIGDEQTGLLHFERLMDQGRIGVVRLDATVCGGITGFISIAAAARKRGLPISCHILPEMHSQLAAMIPEVKWVELFPRENGLDSLHMLLRSEPRIENGCYLPPALDRKS